MFNGERLRILREEKNLTQEQLAEIFNVSDATINRYEQCKRQPDTDTLDKFADFFDVTTDYLLGRTEVRKFDNSNIIAGISRIALEKRIEDEIKKRLKEQIIKVLEG
jgi:transcriptional regulator with XRE-family HTH domain